MSGHLNPKGYASCLKMETFRRDELVTYWSDTPKNIRMDCDRRARSRSGPSYLMLSICTNLRLNSLRAEKESAAAK
jgi:hypothetical protein